jgi:phosphatidylserine decarboxylase
LLPRLAARRHEERARLSSRQVAERGTLASHATLPGEVRPHYDGFRMRGALERSAVAALAWPALSRLAGRLADLRLPRALLAPLIRGYSRVYGVDLGEAELPPEAYPTFNAFFTRRLREGARPIDGSAGVVVSPSDSRLSLIGSVPGDGLLEQVKGSRYALAALLGSEQDRALFASGVHATLYLSPAMYHRVHSPVDGEVVAWRYLPGRLYAVNALGVRSVPGLLARNERVVVRMETQAHGAVAVVLVGATNVGRIGLAFAGLVTNRGHRPGETRPPRPIPLRRGDELGVFNLGSTVVLLAEDGALAPAAAEGGMVRVGEALFRGNAGGKLS